MEGKAVNVFDLLRVFQILFLILGGVELSSDIVHSNFTITVRWTNQMKEWHRFSKCHWMMTENNICFGEGRERILVGFRSSRGGNKRKAGWRRKEVKAAGMQHFGTTSPPFKEGKHTVGFWGRDQKRSMFLKRFSIKVVQSHLGLDASLCFYLWWANLAFICYFGDAFYFLW